MKYIEKIEQNGDNSQKNLNDFFFPKKFKRKIFFRNEYTARPPRQLGTVGMSGVDLDFYVLKQAEVKRNQQ